MYISGQWLAQMSHDVQLGSCKFAHFASDGMHSRSYACIQHASIVVCAYCWVSGCGVLV